MNLLDLVKGRYDREARLAPALLTVLPLVAVALAMLPQLRTGAAALGTLAAGFGGVLWLTQLGRDSGKRAEPALFAGWGGKPTTAMLRHGDVAIQSRTKERIHGELARALGRPLPSAEEERADPGSADLAYDDAVAWLIGRTRDTSKYALLFDENVNYGFRRNLWALKPIALGLAGASLVAALVKLAVDLRAGRAVSTETAAAAALTSAYLVVLVLTVTRAWVRVAARAYARRLLETAEGIAASATRAEG